MKVYRGVRGRPQPVEVIDDGGTGSGARRSYDLPPRPDLFAQPPGPFDWGGSGPGVVHLAAAVLADRGLESAVIRAMAPHVARMLARLPAADDFELSDTFFDAFVWALRGAIATRRGEAKPGAAEPAPAAAKREETAPDRPPSQPAGEHAR